MIKTEIEIVDVLLLVAVALVGARLLGYTFHKFKQPAVLGELLAGIILGFVALYIFSGVEFSFFDFKFVLSKYNYNSDPIVFLAEIGILFLLFISGLEIRLSSLKEMGKTSIFVAIGGVVFPLVIGFYTALLFFNYGHQDSLIIGLILTATSVGVTVRTLMDLHVLDTDVGITILGGAVIDDVLGIILLAFVMGVESVYSVVWIGLRIVIFFFIFLYLGLHVIDKILDLGEKIHLPKSFLSISIAILLIYAFFADKAGISGIIGAFVAGILIGQNVRSSRITPDVKTIGFGFFIPIFFVQVGARIWSEGGITIDYLFSIAVFAFVIIIVSIIGKILGCGLGARLAGMTNRQSLQIGVGMIPRMELALIIVSAAISKELLSGDLAQSVLITTVLLALVTTLITPPVIKALFKSEE